MSIRTPIALLAIAKTSNFSDIREIGGISGIGWVKGGLRGTKDWYGPSCPLASNREDHMPLVFFPDADNHPLGRSKCPNDHKLTLQQRNRKACCKNYYVTSRDMT